MARLLLALAVSACLGAAGCGLVKRHDAETEPVVVAEWAHRDLQMAAEKLASSLDAKITTGRQYPRPPVAYFAKVLNKTTDPSVDMRNITDRVLVLASKSGAMRFTAANEAQEEIINQLRFQHGGLFDAATVKEIGKQIGADYFLYGELTQITEAGGSAKAYYYKLTLKLANCESGIIEWADDADFLKVKSRNFLGL